jgi:hypothetical protein
MYRRDHCCRDVANSAHVRLMTKLKNQSEFTQMAYFGGVNGGGLTTGEMDLCVAFESARTP